jgi:uncharacterized membrane protein
MISYKKTGTLMIHITSTKSFIMGALLTASALAHDDARDHLPVCDTQNEKIGGFCKCYGAAVSGHNSCSNKTGTHSCAGAASEDCDPGEYKVVKAPTCKKSKKNMPRQQK